MIFKTRLGIQRVWKNNYYFLFKRAGSWTFDMFLMRGIIFNAISPNTIFGFWKIFWDSQLWKPGNCFVRGNGRGPKTSSFKLAGIESWKLFFWETIRENIFSKMRKDLNNEENLFRNRVYTRTYVRRYTRAWPWPSAGQSCTRPRQQKSRWHDSGWGLTWHRYDSTGEETNGTHGG